MPVLNVRIALSYLLLERDCLKLLFRTGQGGDVFLLQEKFLRYGEIDQACREYGLASWYMTSITDFIGLRKKLDTREFKNTLIWVHIMGKKAYDRGFAIRASIHWELSCLLTMFLLGYWH